MKPWLVMIALAVSACDAADTNQSSGAVAPPASTMADGNAPMSRPAAEVPMPKDQAELDRMILAGFTPHADHLHRPGETECPLSKGSDVVM